MSEQTKPFHVGHRKGQRHYGIRHQGSISIRDDRPWYKGWFWLNGVNTNFLWDKEGRYMRAAYGFMRVVGKSNNRRIA